MLDEKFFNLECSTVVHRDNTITYCCDGIAVINGIYVEDMSEGNSQCEAISKLKAKLINSALGTKACERLENNQQHSGRTYSFNKGSRRKASLKQICLISSLTKQRHLNAGDMAMYLYDKSICDLTSSEANEMIDWLKNGEVIYEDRGETVL